MIFNLFGMIQEALQKSSSEYLDLPDGISTPRKDENTLPAKYIAYENGQEIEVNCDGLVGNFSWVTYLHQLCS